MSKAQPPASRQTFVEAVAGLVEASRLSQTKIAHALGYENPNMITLFKTGRTRMPAEKVVPFAKALDQDPGPLLRHWFEAHMPGILTDVEHYLTPPRT